MPLMQTQDTEYKPWGLSAGAMVGQQQADQEAANLLALQDSILGNTIKGVEAGRAVSDYSNPEMEQLRQSGIMGDNQVKTAAGKTAMGTQMSDMNAKIAENVQKAGAAKTLTTINQLDNFLAMAGKDGPMGPQAAIAAIADPAERAHVAQLIQQHGIGVVKDYFSKLSNDLKTALADNPTVRGKLAEEQLKGDLHNKGVSITANAMLKGKQMDIHAGKFDKAQKSAEELWIKFQSLSPDKAYVAANAALTSSRHPITGQPLNELDKAALTQVVQSAKAVLDQHAAATAAGNPNAISAAKATGLQAQQTPVLPGVGTSGASALPPGVKLKTQNR